LILSKIELIVKWFMFEYIRKKLWKRKFYWFKWP